MKINVVAMISGLMSVLINAVPVVIKNWSTDHSDILAEEGWTSYGYFFEGRVRVIDAKPAGDPDVLKIIYIPGVSIELLNEGRIPFQYYIQDTDPNNPRWLMHAIASGVHHRVAVKSGSIWVRRSRPTANYPHNI